MAARLSFDERARIEALQTAGVDAQQIARQLGRAPSTIYREQIRNSSDNDGYDASVAQRFADLRARRPKQPKLAADPELAAKVHERQVMRWSPHAISADLRAEGYQICAETIYAACYDRTGSRGLSKEAWRLLPRRCRKRKPRNRITAKPNALGDYKPITQRPIAVEQRVEAGHYRRRPNHRHQQRQRHHHTRRTLHPTNPARSPTTRSHRETHRHSNHRSTVTSTQTFGQNSHLGPRTRNGALGRHRTSPQHRHLLLRTAFTMATRQQRTNQRTTQTLATQTHRSQHQPSPPCCHRRQPQPHAPQTPQLAISPQHLH